MLKKIRLLLALVPTQVSASGLDDDRRTAQFVNKLMTVTMMCEKVIGRGHYQAARSLGVVRLAKYLGDVDAAKAVRGVEDRLKEDPRMAQMQDKADANNCIEVINDLYFEYSDID